MDGALSSRKVQSMSRPFRPVLLSAVALALIVFGPLTSANSTAETTEPAVTSQITLPASKQQEDLHVSSTAETQDSPTSAAVLEPGREYARNPLRVQVADEATARLEDLAGNNIPFAADADGADGVVRLPSLLAGSYSLIDSGVQVNFKVTYEQNFLERPASLADLTKGAPTPKMPLYVIVAAAAMLGTVVVRKRRGLILAVIFIAAGGGAAITSLPSGTVPADVSTCMNLSDDVERNQCLFDRVLYLTSTEGGNPSSARVELAAAENIRGCHEVAHEFGKYSYILGGYEAVAQKGPHNCDGGFYHGALEAASIYLGDEEFMERARTYCSNILDEGSTELGNCAHGLGHGGMFRFAGDLERVVEFCQTLDNSSREIESCSGAAYMEHARLMNAAGGDPAFMPVPATPTLELCPSLAAELAVQCYNGVAMGTPITPTSADELLEMCNNEPGPGANRLTCVDGVMQESINHVKDFETAAQRCTILDGAAERAVCVAKIAQRIGMSMPNIGVEKICDASGIKDIKLCRIDPTMYWEHLRSDQPKGQSPSVIAVDPFAPNS
jgi:hypothetical protein